jgi:GTPase
VHLVDPLPQDGRDPLKDWKVINEELKAYRAGLEMKPQIVVANKMDAHPDPSRLAPLEEACRNRRIPYLEISAVSGEGLKDLKERIWRELDSLRQAQQEVDKGQGATRERNLSSGSNVS